MAVISTAYGVKGADCQARIMVIVTHDAVGIGRAGVCEGK